MRAVRFEGALRLTVGEVDQVLQSLGDAKVLKNLSGRQRQQVEDAINGLTKARKLANQGWVEINPELAVEILRCVIHVQTWFGNMLNEFGNAE